MIRLRVLGSVELSGNQGGPLASILAQPKRLSLLAYLATAQPRGFQQRDSLLARFWPELDEPRARKALNQSVTFLRQELRDEGDVIVSRGADAIGVDAGLCWCDAVAFEDAAQGGRPDEALELYRGGFLEGWFAEGADGFEEWLERQRSRLRGMAAEAAVAVADARQRDGDYATAIASARRAVELSHPDERTVRRLLELLDEAGDRASALLEFSEFSRRLADDVGAEPSAETRALVDRIRLRANPVTREPTTRRSDLAGATTPAAQSAGAGAPLGRESGGPRRRARRAWIGAAAAAALVVAVVATWLELRPPVMRGAQSLAIAPFSAADGDTALVRLGQNLVTTLSANLDGIGELRVADAMAVLSHARTKGPLLSVEAAVDIARRLRVRSAGYGTLVKEAGIVHADLALYEVRNPESPLLRVSATAPIDSIAMLSDSLTWRLLREIWSKRTPPTPNVAAISTRSVVALRHFLDGERAFARWAATDADEAYKRAIEADTTFWFAHYRYRVAHGWFGPGPPDTTITNRLSRHLAELPPRERRLLRAVDSTQTVTDHQRELKALLDENPDYAPAVYEYGDFIFHFGGFAGLDARDAIPYYQRLTQLVPWDVTSLSHYGALCLMVGDRSCVQQVVTQLDSVITSDPEPPHFARLLSRGFGVALHRPSPSWADSLARLVVADSIFPNLSCLPCIMGMFDQQPDFLIEQDRLYERIKAWGRPDLVEPWQTLGALGRGDVARLDSIWTQVPRMPWFLRAEVTIPEALILTELQGLRDPSPATADKALALVARTTATPVDSIRITGRWIAGASALWRGDTTLFRAELDALGRDPTALARTASRSLNALSLGRLGGQPGRAAAAESLLVLERDNGEHFGQRLMVALVADRIVGAQWLVEQGRYAPADSLLLYPRVFLAGWEHGIMSQVTFGKTMLLRSQIAEALGNKENAIEFAKTFLATFDMAPERAKPWLDQARGRVTRLGGHLQAPPASPVSVR